MMAVSSAAAPLQIPQVSVASSATTPRPMLVPPHMQIEIAAATQSPRTPSIGTTLIANDVCLLIQNSFCDILFGFNRKYFLFRT